MNSSARVSSIEALRGFQVAMEAFDHDARSAMTALQLELRRVLDWIEHDRPRYWPEALRRAYDRVAQARNDLERCQMRAGDDNARSCYDEKKALERAKLRVRTCEEKLQALKFWRRQVRHDVEEFSGQLTKLESHLDLDWARALAALQRMATALERYAEVRQPTPDASGGGQAAGANSARTPAGLSAASEAPEPDRPVTDASEIDPSETSPSEIAPSELEQP
ncbi:MAG: hypothetical protein J5I93_16035 [Pirellulaceae bacterium]|nr:hypothetical protein [Pirellulaceae bacterium]